jgi:hypothetical protein
MSIVFLLIAVIVAFALSAATEAVPQILWIWVYLPKWLLWPLLLAVIAWCIDD